jgi:uncharacterized protein YcnI
MFTSSTNKYTPITYISIEYRDQSIVRVALQPDTPVSFRNLFLHSPQTNTHASHSPSFETNPFLPPTAFP